MEYVEFCEFISRISSMSFKDKEDATFVDKINLVLDELLAIVKIKR